MRVLGTKVTFVAAVLLTAGSATAEPPTTTLAQYQTTPSSLVNRGHYWHPGNDNRHGGDHHGWHNGDAGHHSRHRFGTYGPYSSTRHWHHWGDQPATTSDISSSPTSAAASTSALTAVTSVTSQKSPTTSLSNLSTTVVHHRSSSKTSTSSNAPTQPSSGGSKGVPRRGDGKQFVIPVNDGSSSRFRKRSLKYLAFNTDGEGILVDNKSDGALFTLDSEGNLVTGGQYVRIDTTGGSVAFERTSTKPTGGSKWHVSSDGTLTLQGAQGYCEKPDGTVFIVVDQNPPNCSPVTLAAQVISASSSTSSSVRASTTPTPAATTVTPTSTATQADPSADLDVEPAATPTATAAQNPDKRSTYNQAHRRYGRRYGVFHA